MRAYDLDSDTQFIWSEAMGFITVSTLDNVSNPTVKDSDWKHRVACIGPGESYDCLSISGKKLHGEALNKLSQELGDSYVLVNREGYCFLSTHAITGASFQAHYFRLNDMFDWSEYDVKPVFRTVWYRSGLENGKVILHVEKGNQTGLSMMSTRCTIRMDEDENEDDDEELDYDVNQVVEERQVEIPSDIFIVSTGTRQSYHAKVHESNMLPEFTPLDEDVGSFPRKKVVVHTSDGTFDREDWWIVRAKMGKSKCLIGYYEGSETPETMDDGEFYFLPYNKGQTLTASAEFFVARMRNTGRICLAFKL